MRDRTLALLFSVCCFAFEAGTSVGAAPASVESRTAAQNAIFEEYYQSELEAHPERATAYGDYRYNDRLDEYSLTAINSQQAEVRRFLRRLEQIPTKGLA